MSFADVRAGIHANLRAHTGVRNIIGGMPLNIHATPAFVTEFEGGTRQGQTGAFHWRFLVHAILEDQVQDIAESAIDTMVIAAYTALSPKLNDSAGRPRSTLGGAANHCWFEDVRSGSQNDGFITFGTAPNEKTYRHIAFVVVVKTHEEF